MAIVAAVMGVVVAGLAIPFAGVLGIGAKSLSHTVEDLPANLRTQPLAQQTQIVDQSGTTIATLYDQNRINVPLSQISRKMVKSIVAIEDYRYYQHGALDLKGTLRALVTNQASGGSVQGGSSITQQMVKMTLVDQAKTAKQRKAATADTYARKLTELRYAIAFEQNYSKDWILERYLNIAYYGDGAYGVQAAARHYFDTNAKDLTLLQGATLAGLVKNPSGYDPITNPDRGIQRRNVVLDRLAQLHVIKQHRADLLKKRPLGLHPVATPNGCVNSSAPFFCDYVVNYLEQDPALGKTVDARKKLLYTGGLTIHTTISLPDQRAADTSVHNHVFPTDQAIGALAMVEPGTGDVKAISQSRPMGRDAKAGQTFLNYVVPQKYGDSNGFQPGSTFKAFVLAAAIQQGIPLSQTIASPMQVHIPMSEYRVCGGKHFASTDTWSPHSSTISGTMNAYTGTQESVNTFFAKLELQTGLCEPYRLAKAMGIGLDDPATEMVPSFTLGVASVSPLELADAYATFAARGLHCDPRPVVSIDDSNGNQLKTYQPQCQQVIAAPVADAVNDVLRGVHVADRLRRQPDPQPGVGRQDRYHRQQHVGVVHGLHPQPRHRGDGRRRQQRRPLDHAERPDHRRHLHRRRPRLHHRRPDVVRRDEPDPAVAARRDVHPAQRPGRQRRSDHGARRVRRALRPGGGTAHAGRLPGRRRRLPQLRLRDRHRRLHQPGRREPERQRHGGHHLPLERHAVRSRGTTGTATAAGTATGTAAAAAGTTTAGTAAG